MVDVVGYFSATGDDYVPVEPTRLLDSRANQAPPAETGTSNAGIASWDATTFQVVDVTGVGPVPETGVTAVVAHVTSVRPSAFSFLTVWADGPLPAELTAVKNFGPTTTGAFGHAGLTNDIVTIPVGADGNIRMYNHGGITDFVFDVIGYYTN